MSVEEEKEDEGLVAETVAGDVMAEGTAEACAGIMGADEAEAIMSREIV